MLSQLPFRWEGIQTRDQFRRRDLLNDWTVAMGHGRTMPRADVNYAMPLLKLKSFGQSSARCYAVGCLHRSGSDVPIALLSSARLPYAKVL